MCTTEHEMPPYDNQLNSILVPYFDVYDHCLMSMTLDQYELTAKHFKSLKFNLMKS